ncbi:MAG: DEAD/DEAH box helicase [Acidimicrobiales bacterium]
MAALTTEPLPVGPPEADLAAFESLLGRLAERRPVESARSDLVDAALELSTRPGFDTFVSLPRLRFEPFEHQLQAAGWVLRRMQARAVLADEVGLGKTIEAGLVASELRLRGLAGRVLIVVPAGLVEQWQEELDRKFALPSVVAARPWRPSDIPGDEPVVITSLATARRTPLRDVLREVHWDLLIVDEAHRVRNPRSASGRLVRTLRSRHLLLLTATPVENRLADIFELVNLVRPGHLGTPKEFRARHGPGGGGQPARDLTGLRARLGGAMVRHRRSEVAVILPRRLAETRRVPAGADEAELYRLVSERVRHEGRHATTSTALALRAVQRLAGSSPRAVAPTLDRMGWHSLAARAQRVGATQKAATLLDLVRAHRERREKVVVFTAFRATLDYLAGLVTSIDLPAAAYHGSLSRRDKEAAIRSFAADAPVLLTTEAAGEGRNLQFCHSMINFDLPWNPMQIEQRLGRIHRIGQHHQVLLTNLVTRGTIEDRILGVLEAKINLFELVVGELDMILGRVDDLDFERAVYAAHVDSRDDTELGSRIDALGDELADARRRYLDSRARNDLLVEEVEAS